MYSVRKGTLLMTIVLGGVAAGDVFDGADWLRDPLFSDVHVLDLWHKEKVTGPKPHGPRNVHTLFRNEIVLAERPEHATLAFSADDYAKLYLNGRFVVQGPEPGYPFAYPYCLIDVSGLLEAGPNCLAAHVYYQGLLNRVWYSADNRSGFILALDLRYGDGREERFVTGPSWRCFQLEAFPTDRTIGYDTQFAEDIDMRRVPIGWRIAGFNDSEWVAPMIGRQDHVFVRQVTPPLQITTVSPAVTREKGPGHYFYDFGREIVGHTRIRVCGPAGHVITVRHGEELDGPETVRYKMRAKCVYEEFPVLSGGDDVMEFYDYKAFRYTEILNAPSPPEVWVEVRRHPFDAAAATLDAGEHVLEQIWNLCKHGVAMGSQGGFLDCPSREKGQYLGDAVITARSHLWLTGDMSLTRKCLLDFHYSQRICPGMMAVAPCSFMQEIAEYSLQWPLLLEHYYWHSGDRDFLERMVDQAIPGLFRYFARFEDESGLLSGMTEKWVLVDWPENLRDDYDYEYAKDKANTVLNAFYYGALNAVSRLACETGRDASQYEARAARVAQAFARRLANPATGLYVDAPGSKHSSLHANAVPLAFGLTAGAKMDAMLELIRAKRLNCGVYIASYVIEACFRNGAPELGYALLTSEDEHSWREMLRHGATACMEAWGPDQKWNTSWCHPWSSSPVYLITEYVFGLRPGAPGWGTIRFAPPHIADLPAAQLTVPHPAGQVSVRYDPETGYTITAPDGVSIETIKAEGVAIAVRNTASHSRPQLQEGDMAFLDDAGWAERVGDGRGVWVSVSRQMLYVIEGRRAAWQARCSTAAAGIGAELNSMKTPLGWHRVQKKVGGDAAWGQEFKSQQPTSVVWRPGQDTKEDMVLTRILVLEGLEAGKNRGQNGAGVCVDSMARGIYIHGTNDEARIGSPVSHGCVRLTNDDVITCFDHVPEGTMVLITE